MGILFRDDDPIYRSVYIFVDPVTYSRDQMYLYVVYSEYKTLRERRREGTANTKLFLKQPRVLLPSYYLTRDLSTASTPILIVISPTSEITATAILATYIVIWVPTVTQALPPSLSALDARLRLPGKLQRLAANSLSGLI